LVVGYWLLVIGCWLLGRDSFVVGYWVGILLLIDPNNQQPTTNNQQPTTNNQ
jgi:hypothetical protein